MLSNWSISHYFQIILYIKLLLSQPYPMCWIKNCNDTKFKVLNATWLLKEDHIVFPLLNWVLADLLSIISYAWGSSLQNNNGLLCWLSTCFNLQTTLWRSRSHYYKFKPTDNSLLPFMNPEEITHRLFRVCRPHTGTWSVPLGQLFYTYAPTNQGLELVWVCYSSYGLEDV